MDDRLREPCVLLKYGELVTKVRSRGRFERQLLGSWPMASSTAAAA